MKKLFDNIWFTLIFILILSGLALGLANTIFPAIAQPFTRQITKNDTVALGHTGNFGYTLSAIIGKAVGDKEKSTEDINFPKGLSFLSKDLPTLEPREFPEGFLPALRSLFPELFSLLIKYNFLQRYKI